MFGYSGGDTPDQLARKQGFRGDARHHWSFLTPYDLSTIKTRAQLETMVQTRGSLSVEQARADVDHWMVGKQF